MNRIPSAGRLPAAVLMLCTLSLSTAIPGAIAANQATPAATTATDDPCAAIVAAGTPAAEHADHADDEESAHADDSGSGPTETAAEIGNPADYPFALVFIDAMIAHQQGAILMAEIALIRAEHEELRKLASTIIATRETEIASLQEWRVAWYGDAGPVPQNVTTGLADEGLMLVGGPADAGVGMGGPVGPTGTAHDTYLLCTATGSFDLAFINQMIPHNQGAVGMSLLALERAEHVELRALAEAINSARQTEIAQMTEWQIAWAAEATGTPVAAGHTNPRRLGNR